MYRSGVLTIFFNIIYRECLIFVRRPLTLIHPWMFFIMVIFLFPMIFAPTTTQLAQLIPGVFWIAALLSYLLSIEHFFERDHDSGLLDMQLISPFPLSLTVFAKILTHWLFMGLPLALLALFLGYLFGLSWSESQILCVSLLLGTPTLSALGTLLAAIGIAMSAQAVSSRGLLLAMLLIPLSIPILLFGTGSVLAATAHQSATASLSFLGAIAIIALLGTPLASSAALRLR